jgi:hypothetical protein
VPHVATVEPSGRFLSCICEFVGDSFDDGEAASFIRGAFEAGNNVFTEIEIEDLQGIELSRQFRSEVIPRAVELTSERFSQKITDRYLLFCTKLC